MTRFTLHNMQTAPEPARPLLEKSQQDFGMIPNLHAVMAEAPGVLEAYQTLHRLVLESSFDNVEKTVLWQSINVEHECHYCVPAHSGIARMMEVPEEIDTALRRGEPLPEARLETLRDFVLTVVRKRGNLSDQDFDAFFRAGFNQRQALEVVLVVAQKTLSNYINHFAETPLDEPFKALAWDEATA